MSKREMSDIEYRERAMIAALEGWNAAIAEAARLEEALKLIRDYGPVAAGSAKPMSFRDWAKMIARNAVSAGERADG